MKNLITNNIKHGWKTTLVGIVLLIASVVSVFISNLNINWTEALPVVLVSLVLLGIKDPRKKECNGEKESN